MGKRFESINELSSCEALIGPHVKVQRLYTVVEARLNSPENDFIWERFMKKEEEKLTNDSLFMYVLAENCEIFVFLLCFSQQENGIIWGFFQTGEVSPIPKPLL